MTECKSVFRQNFIHRHFDLDLAHTTNHTHKPTRFPNTILAKSSNKLSLPMALPPIPHVHEAWPRAARRKERSSGSKARSPCTTTQCYSSLLTDPLSAELHSLELPTCKITTRLKSQTKRTPG